MIYAKTIINGVEVVAFSDGSIEKPFFSKTRRTFGYPTKNGYRKTCIASREFYIHRIIAQAFGIDLSDGLQVDHINGKRSDNRLGNLRSATQSDNLRGSKKVKSSATSNLRGVSWISARKAKNWVAQIYVKPKNVYLGFFETEEEAGRAYDKAAKEFGYMPEALNFK